MAKKFNILHVDNSNAIILYIKIMLMEVPGIRSIESVRTVAKAEDALRTKPVDVAILDINLPDGNGIQLLEWVKKRYPSIMVIMFTNSSDRFFRERALSSGADYFLDKSMEFEDIIRILSEYTTNPSHEKKV